MESWKSRSLGKGVDRELLTQEKEEKEYYRPPGPMLGTGRSQKTRGLIILRAGCCPDRLSLEDYYGLAVPGLDSSP